jgi:hypothetical protein
MPVFIFWVVDTIVSEKHSASDFRAEDGGSMLLQKVDIYL